MLYYTATAKCPFCPDRPFACRLVAEVEPPPDAVFRVRCPNDGGPLSVPFGAFDPCEPFPPASYHLKYPAKPPPPKPRWWQFWKW